MLGIAGCLQRVTKVKHALYSVDVRPSHSSAIGWTLGEDSSFITLWTMYPTQFNHCIHQAFGRHGPDYSTDGSDKLEEKRKSEHDVQPVQ